MPASWLFLMINYFKKSIISTKKINRRYEQTQDQVFILQYYEHNPRINSLFFSTKSRCFIFGSILDIKIVLQKLYSFMGFIFSKVGQFNWYLVHMDIYT